MNFIKIKCYIYMHDETAMKTLHTCNKYTCSSN